MLLENRLKGSLGPVPCQTPRNAPCHPEDSQLMAEGKD